MYLWKFANLPPGDGGRGSRVDIMHCVMFKDFHVSPMVTVEKLTVGKDR